MARTPKRLIGYWQTKNDGRVWVYKAGRGYALSHDGNEHSCHASIRGLRDTKKEALIVFHVEPTEFCPAG